VAHPYREPPRPEPARGAGGSLALPTVVFGLLCGIAGHALGGPACGLFATVGGVVLILVGPIRD
jgi:hypothetical protein